MTEVTVDEATAKALAGALWQVTRGFSVGDRIVAVLLVTSRLAAVSSDTNHSAKSLLAEWVPLMEDFIDQHFQNTERN